MIEKLLCQVGQVIKGKLKGKPFNLIRQCFNFAISAGCAEQFKELHKTVWGWWCVFWKKILNVVTKRAKNDDFQLKKVVGQLKRYQYSKPDDSIRLVFKDPRYAAKRRQQKCPRKKPQTTLKARQKAKAKKVSHEIQPPTSHPRLPALPNDPMLQCWCHWCQMTHYGIGYGRTGTSSLCSWRTATL